MTNRSSSKSTTSGSYTTEENAETQQQDVKRISTFKKIEKVLNKKVEPLKKIIESDPFQYSIIGLIVLNSILMGVATFDFVGDNEDIQSAFDTCDEVILFIFTIELGLNFIIYHFDFFFDAWRVFDFITVLTSWIFKSATIIRSFRIFRAFRLFGRVKSLQRIMLALFSTGEQMVSILVVLLLIFYIFGVMFTQLFSDCAEYGCYEPGQPDLFKQLDSSLYSLFVLMNLESWGNTTRMLQNKYTWAWIPVIAFILISSFIMLNLVIAVLCDSLADQNEPEAENKEAAKDDDSKEAAIEKEKKEKEEKENYKLKQNEKKDQLRKTKDKLILDIDKLTNDVTVVYNSYLHLWQQVNSNSKGNLPVLEDCNWEQAFDFPVSPGFMVHKQEKHL